MKLQVKFCLYYLLITIMADTANLRKLTSPVNVYIIIEKISLFFP